MELFKDKSNPLVALPAKLIEKSPLVSPIKARKIKKEKETTKAVLP